MAKSTKFEGYSWNTDWILGFKSVDDFLKHPNNQARWKENNEAKLKELYQLVHGKPPKAKPVDPDKETTTK